MAPPTKCKHCGKIIVRNVRGEWGCPIVPTTICHDDVPHEPDRGSGNSPGTVVGIAIGASIFDTQA